MDLRGAHVILDSRVNLASTATSTFIVPRLSRALLVWPKTAMCFVNALETFHPASGVEKSAAVVTKYTHAARASRIGPPADTKERVWSAPTVRPGSPVTDAVNAKLASQGRIVMYVRQATTLRVALQCVRPSVTLTRHVTDGASAAVMENAFAKWVGKAPIAATHVQKRLMDWTRAPVIYPISSHTSMRVAIVLAIVRAAPLPRCGYNLDTYILQHLERGYAMAGLLQRVNLQTTKHTGFSRERNAGLLRTLARQGQVISWESRAYLFAQTGPFIPAFARIPHLLWLSQPSLRGSTL
jgi:hypothetical protein